MISASGVSWSKGGKTILDQLDIDFDASSYTVVIGPNGAGKSTLLRCLLGLTSPDRGQITVRGRPLHDWGPRTRAGEISWLPQHGKVREPVPVIDLVASARFRFDESRKSAVFHARAALEALELGAFAHRTVSTLSGGESQWVQLACLVAQDAAFWLLDEPANHLDPAHRFGVYDVLYRQWKAGRGVICVTHDIGLLGYLVPRDEEENVQVVGLRDGKLVFSSRLGASGFAAKVETLFDVKIQPVDIDGRRHWLPHPASTP